MPDQPIISRIAPTPSGYLHLGNALNFLLTWEFVRRNNGRLRLRIDDCDSTRARPQFIEDIFRTLEWLGIDWDEGPSGPDDFYAHYSQGARRDQFFAAIDNLQRAYNCRCSRKAIKKTFGSTIYRGSCRHSDIPFVRGETARRIIVDRPVSDRGQAHDLGPHMGDFVVWTRDDTPAYQLVSLVEDETHGITHIFRGEDLYTSTLAQKYLARELGYTGFLRAHVNHHPLIYDHNGNKLAKSAGAASLMDIRQAGKGVDYVLKRLAPFLAPLRASLSLHGEKKEEANHC